MFINLTLDWYLTYFFCCAKFFSVVFSFFFFCVCLVSYIANYDSNNENIVP